MLEDSRTTNSELDQLLNNLDADESSFDNLKQWLLTEDGRNVSSSNLNSDATQTVISFQAATLDWQDAVDFESELSSRLSDVSEINDNNFEAKISGRSLILAQVTADVADSAVISTATVAGVILFMLVAINSVRQLKICATRFDSRSSPRICDMDPFDGDCYLGLRNYGINRISTQFTNRDDRSTDIRFRCRLCRSPNDSIRGGSRA